MHSGDDGFGQQRRPVQTVNPCEKWLGITAILLYSGSAHNVIRMYFIIRCPGGCRTFTYVDRFQKWKLCPLCGHAYEVAKVPAYLEVEEHHEAEHIVKQMEKHLHANKKKDFTPEEKEELRHHYTTALRKKKGAAN